jgi:hypothetical protein
MYHPHFHSHLGLPNGMFGTIFVGRVPLPAGQTVGDEVVPANVEIAQEFPMVLNDLSGRVDRSTSCVVVR